MIKEQVLQKRGKALVIYRAAHFYREMPVEHLPTVGNDVGIVRMLEVDYPGRTLVVIPVGGGVNLPPGVTLRINPDFARFDRALNTQVRPVLVSLQRWPLRDFTAEEFIGHHVLNCRGAGGCVSIFQGSSLTLGQVGDAALYVGGTN